jgi:hypothetical protein
MNERKYYLEYLALVALLITFFGFFAVKVWDIDFWWHIASGRNILENGAIPSVDPFGVYDAANVWGQTVLKSQWLGQVLLYSVYRWFDVDGVILFRAGVLSLCLAIVYLRCRLAATASLFSFAMTALAGLAILQHTGERPQLFSFLYLSLIFLLLDGFMHSGRRWLIYCIPLVMLVWSNTHAGAVLGVVALGLFGTGHVLENRWSGERFNTPQLSLLFMIMCLSAVALVCTPNGLATIMRIIFVENIFFVEGNPLRDRVSEYAYPWSLWPATLYYWVFIGVTLVSLPGFFNKTYLKQGIVVFAIGMISLTGYRYIPLFVLLAAPYVAASLNRMLSRIKPPDIAVNLFVLVVALAFLGYGFKQERVFQHGMQEGRFPVGAVAFIKANKLGGKMFNTMNWGGYLIWQLPGTATVFIDGRILDPRRLVPYTHILWMTPEGKLFFEQANFDLVLVPNGNAFSGERYPIVAYLQNHTGWQVVYQDKAGYLFARRAQ